VAGPGDPSIPTTRTTRRASPLTPADETPTASAQSGEEDRVTMALTLRPASLTPQSHRLRHAAAGPVPVLLAAGTLAAGFLVLVADVVAKLG
jgi:hypothetical protein